MLELLGGYESWGYWIYVLGVMCLGCFLNSTDKLLLRLCGIGLFMLGSVELLGYIVFELDNTHTIPEYATIFPMLFMAIIILSTFKMLAMKPIIFKKVNTSSKEEESE